MGLVDRKMPDGEAKATARAKLGRMAAQSAGILERSERRSIGPAEFVT